VSRIIRFFKEVWVELGKVVWPSRRDALRITGVVILFSVFVALFLGLVDFGLTRLIALIAS